MGFELALLAFGLLLASRALYAYVLGRRRGSAAELLSHPGVLHMLLAGTLLLTASIGPSPLVLAPSLLLLALLIWIAHQERVARRDRERSERAAELGWEPDP
jgi:hypothetical protein